MVKNLYCAEMNKIYLNFTAVPGRLVGGSLQSVNRTVAYAKLQMRDFARFLRIFLLLNCSSLTVKQSISKEINNDNNLKFA